MCLFEQISFNWVIRTKTSSWTSLYKYINIHIYIGAIDSVHQQDWYWFLFGLRSYYWKSISLFIALTIFCSTFPETFLRQLTIRLCVNAELARFSVCVIIAMENYVYMCDCAARREHTGLVVVLDTRAKQHCVCCTAGHVKTVYSQANHQHLCLILSVSSVTCVIAKRVGETPECEQVSSCAAASKPNNHRVSLKTICVFGAGDHSSRNYGVLPVGHTTAVRS